jgi:hypothetical protein
MERLNEHRFQLLLPTKSPYGKKIFRLRNPFKGTKIFAFKKIVGKV